MSYSQESKMSVRLSVLLIFMPIIVFTVAVCVVAAEDWWQGRGRLKRWKE
jgi:hypothetical protein